MKNCYVENKKSDILNIINNEDGYLIFNTLSDIELLKIRQVIEDQWLYRIQLLNSNVVSQFKDLGINNYHKISHLIDHEKVWPSVSRVLPKNVVYELTTMDFFNQLKQVLGDIELADEEKLGWGNMLWRVVRPEKSDYGPLHLDKWFWDLGEDWFEPDYKHIRLNVWIAIYTEPYKNGLIVAPKTQKKTDWQWSQEERHGKLKPVLHEDMSNFDLELLPTKSGDIVIFNNELLHGGVENKAETTRVSLEFTLFLKV